MDFQAYFSPDTILTGKAFTHFLPFFDFQYHVPKLPYLSQLFKIIFIIIEFPLCLNQSGENVTIC